MPARDATRNNPRHMYPPGAIRVKFLVSGQEKKRVRTAVLSHIDQEVRDPRRFELVDRIYNIKLKLDRVPSERADKHLPAKGTLSVGSAEEVQTRTTPVLFPGNMNDLMTPVLPLVGVRVGEHESGRPTAVLALAPRSLSAPRARRGWLWETRSEPDCRLTPFVWLFAAQLLAQLEQVVMNLGASMMQRHTMIAHR